MFYLLLLIIIIVIIILYYRLSKRNANDLIGKHVLITGGSKGIGHSLALLCHQRGANVTIIARDIDCLEKVKLNLLSNCSTTSTQNVLTYSNDVSGEYCDLERTINEAESISGPINMVVCCAGTSVSYRFDETPIDQFNKMIDINYIGTVNTIRASLESMKSAGGGHIVIVSSVAGLLGIYGYSAYSSSKFALLGLAQVLDMELKASNIKITIAFPPDTDTPGFALEQLTKPLETKLISESGGLYSSSDVANKILNDALSAKFTSTIGFEGWMVKTACCGMMPETSILEIFLQVFSMGLFRIFALIFLKKCNSQIEKCAQQKQTNKKSD